MDDFEVEKKRRMGRSPAYPFIPVQKALEQARALHGQEGDYFAPLPSAFRAWGYGPKSSGARQTLATLKYYGLIDVQGDGDARKVKVSSIARSIILDPREDETEKRQLIRQVALMPSAHKAIYKEYPTGLPSDGTVLHYLMTSLNFNQEAARDLLTEFKQTASYASLFEPQESVDIIGEGPDAETLIDLPSAMPLVNQPPDVGRPRLEVHPAVSLSVVEAAPGEAEWMRSPLGKDTSVRILVSGTMGVREIGRLIKLLEAQKTILGEDEEDYDL